MVERKREKESGVRKKKIRNNILAALTNWINIL